MGTFNRTLLVISLLAFSSCNQALKGLAANSDINSVPQSFENPQLDFEPGYEAPPTQPERKTTKPATPSTNQPEEKPTQPITPAIRTDKKADRLIYYAQKIMETEGKKLGTPCNFYVHRVLEAAGYPDDTHRANDFDLYAKKYFKSYKAEDFVYDKNGSEVTRLERHLKSYPERTPFIMQWSRTGRVGHIAFVERIGDKFIIYQASLGRYTARKDQTSPSILLNGYGRRALTVYSEFSTH